MRRFLLPVVAAILIFITASGAGAVGKITEDPNAPGAQKPQDSEQTAKTDARLAFKVTYEARAKSVRVILKDLAEMSGVTLYAGYNDSDWQVRDRKMNVFSKDVPLVQLMSSIARVMKFKWSIRGEPGAYTYRLYMDRRTLLDAEAKRVREEERYKQQQADRRQKMLEDFGKLGDLSEQDLAKLRQENPFMYLLATSGLGKSLGDFFGSVPPALEALATGQEISLSASNLPPMAQQGLVSAVQQLSSLEQRFSGHDLSLPEGLAENASQMTVQINRDMDRMAGMEVSFLLGMMHISYPGADGESIRSADVPFIDPESNFARILGSILDQAETEGKSVNDVAKGREAEFMEAVMSDSKRSDYGEPAPERADDPDLERKVKLEKIESPQLVDVEAALAEASGFALVSDNFGLQFGRLTAKDKEAELQQWLDDIADDYRYNWEKHGRVLELRDRFWFKKRAAQIPDAWLEAWRKTLKETGTLGLDDLAQIAMLTYEQINANVVTDEVLTRSGLMSAIFVGRDLLRLYATLNQGQKAMLLSESGLDLRALSPDQWTAAATLLTRRNASYVQNPDAQITITGVAPSRSYQVPEEDKRPRYAFRATTSDGYPPLDWQFLAPRYQEPPKKEEQPAKEESGDADAKAPDKPDSAPKKS